LAHRRGPSASIRVMAQADIARLVGLAMIWSLSFVFIRVLVPALGPIWVPMLRALVAGVALVAWFAVIRLDADVKRQWRDYAFIGFLNCALPFALYAFAAIHLPASYLVILNALTPLFAAVAGAMWLDERMTLAKLAGLAAGAAGVALVSRAGPIKVDAAIAWSMAASLGAAVCYALSGTWLKKRGTRLNPIAAAGWSQLFAGLELLPAVPFAPAPGPITPLIVANMLALSLVCSGVAYLLYFRLIANVGPTRATTVTFLLPALGMMWGVLFLDETVTPPMLAGALLIIGGTAAVLRQSPVPRAA
jgi:drug/metabolite transporter (DMT)-like permease